MKRHKVGDIFKFKCYSENDHNFVKIIKIDDNFRNTSEYVNSNKFIYYNFKLLDGKFKGFTYWHNNEIFDRRYKKITNSNIKPSKLIDIINI